MILPNLPASSAFKRKVDPIGAQWGHGEYILADIFDALAGANWQRANEGKAAGQESPRPKPYPRPGDELKKQSEQDVRAQAHLAMRERARQRQLEQGERP